MLIENFLPRQCVSWSAYERTKAGLRAVISRGVKVGAPIGLKYNVGRRKNYRSTNDELTQLVLDLSNQGLSTHKISEILSKYKDIKISQPTVWRMLKRLNAA